MKHMKRILFLLAVLCASFSCKSGDKPLPVSADFGKWNETFDQVFTDVAAKGTAELHSLMVLKDGEKIYERYDTGYDASHLNVLWSASKTFTATAVGFAVQDGLLSVNDPVIRFFGPEDLPAEPCAELKQMTVKDLLIMSSGFEHDALGVVRSRTTPHPLRDVLADSFIFTPGERFKYNSANTFLLSAIVTKVTGRTVADYLEEKLFRPLGITRYHWDESTDGYSAGGWGLYLTTESMAKMGQFYLQKGVWNGVRLLDEAWFDEATKPQIYQYDRSNPEAVAAAEGDDWKQGYGYQLWVCTHDSYRMDGAHGQLIIVVPAKGLVVAIASHTGSYKRPMVKSILEYIERTF